MTTERGRRRRFESNPSVNTCELCGLGPGNGRLFRRNGRLFHRECWNAEKE